MIRFEAPIFLDEGGGGRRQSDILNNMSTSKHIQPGSDVLPDSVVLQQGLIAFVIDADTRKTHPVVQTDQGGAKVCGTGFIV